MLGWTQNDLAERARINRRTVVNIESGKHTPTPSTLLSIHRQMNSQPERLGLASEGAIPTTALSPLEDDQVQGLHAPSTPEPDFPSNGFISVFKNARLREARDTIQLTRRPRSRP
jgi:DNA-binding XRE family transcriptional regulator